MNGVGRASISVVLLASAPVGATDIIGLGAEHPKVRFDVPLSVVADEAESEAPPTLSPGERLVMVDLPVSVAVAKGDIDRVGEVVIEVDGAAAGLMVHNFTPGTQLQSEYAGDIQVELSTQNDRHLDGSLGGFLPNPGGAVAQLTPSLSAGRADRKAETEKAARLAPKEAVVVAGAINRRHGVRFKFRPSSQTTLEGERRLRITFIAPPGFDGGELTVACSASGERRVLFVKQRRIWGSATEPVAVRLASHTTERRTVAKPIAVPSDDPADELPALWKLRQRFDQP